MQKAALLFTLLLLSHFSFTQKKHESFVGKLVYSIEIMDTSLREMIPNKKMVIYTNDTLLRIENRTDQLGDQVIVKHLGLDKSYLLIATPFSNYAIQTDHSTEEKDSYPYTYKKKCGTKKILGMKAKRLMVSHANFKEPMEFLYLKKYSTKYVNTLENFPGLPVKYYISSIDGTYKYELISIEYITPEKDLFGIPSDYKRVSFTQFLEEIMQMQGDAPK